MWSKGIKMIGNSTYAVILLRLKNLVSFKRYQFIFLNAQVRGELEVCYWNWKEGADENCLEEIIQELNDRVKERSEWKLVIYDEWQENAEADKAMDVFLRILSGKMDSGDYHDKVEGAFPVQLLYVNSREKEYVPLGENSSFCHIDREGRFGENVRMLQFEKESGNGRKKYFSMFRLCCALLSLAIGQIPYTFMEAGYLYDLDIEIDQEKLGQYVEMLGDRLEQIQICCDEEHENLKQRMRNLEPFPNVTFPKINLKDEEQKTGVRKHIRILSFWEMLKCSDIRNVLQQNRELLLEQMFYPKGVLHEESRKIHRTVEGLQGTENFLNEAAQEVLKKQIGETIDEICAQKDAQLEQQKFEEEIHRTERMIEDQAARLMEKRKRHWILLVFGIIELFVTEPYLVQYILAKEQYKWWPLCGGIALGTIVLVYSGYYFYLWRLHRKRWRAYKKRVYGKLLEYRRNKKIYLENILFLIQKYQYLEKIKREQRQLFDKWNQDREMLACHVRMLENVRQGMESLLHLVEKEKRQKSWKENMVKIDFTREPREEEYFCLSQLQESGYEVNHSGYMSKSDYPFILRLILKKSIQNEAGGDFNG